MNRTFKEGFDSVRRMLAAQQESDVRIALYSNIADDVAGWVMRGLDKREAVDELQEIANAFGIAASMSQDDIQGIMSRAFKDAEERKREEDPDEDAPPRTNGAGQHTAKVYSLPAVKPTPYPNPDPATLPTRKFMFGLHYMRGIVSSTVAPGGFGKTTLALFEALTMVKYDYRVWYISAEDDHDEINRRIAAHVQAHGADTAKLAANLFIDDKNSFTFKIASFVRNAVVYDEPLLKLFELALTANKIDVVILDPFIGFHYLPENDTAAMDGLIKRLSDICKRCSCAIELSHHVRKPSMGQSEVTVYDARGAGAIVNAVRSCRVINQMDRTTADTVKIPPEKRHEYLRIDSGKRNMAPPDVAHWYHLVNVEIANGDRVQALMEWPFPVDVITEDDKSWIKVTLGTRAYRVSSQTREEWFGTCIAERFDRNPDVEADRKWIVKTIKRWASEGLIVKDERQDEKRVKRPHWVLGVKLRDSTHVAAETTAEDDLLE